MIRPDLRLISDLIPHNARVLDLGCGDGELLAHLAVTKSVTGYGVENSPEAIASCLGKGVNVIEHDIDKGLQRFPDASFDVVVMGETLQSIKAPHELLRELLRIGRECIVTIPNFAQWQCRLQLIGRGRMPVARHLPHEWYNTPNIHLCTLTDFTKLCDEEGIRVVDRHVLSHDYRSGTLLRWLPNLFASIAIYQLGRS